MIFSEKWFPFFKDHALVLRTHQPVGMLGAQDVIVEVRDPLAAGDGEGQIFHSVLEMHRDAVPEETRIFLDEISPRGVAELSVQADLLELEEKRVRLPGIQW